MKLLRYQVMNLVPLAGKDFGEQSLEGQVIIFFRNHLGRIPSGRHEGLYASKHLKHLRTLYTYKY